MAKKGQVTYFIIVGVLLLLIVGVFLYIRSMDTGAPEQPEDRFTPIQNYIELCIEESAIEGGYYISEHGGWNYVPHDFINYNGFLVTNVYNYSTGTSSLLTLEKIEENYASYVKGKLVTCTAGFEEFIKQGFDISYEAPSVTVGIGLEAVTVEVNYPVDVKIAESEKLYREFPREVVPLRIGQMYKEAYEIVDMTVQSPEDIQITYLTNNLKENQIGYQVPRYGDTMIYFLHDTRVTGESEALNVRYNNGKPHAFIFGARFSTS